MNKIKTRGDRIASAFNRFPMLLVVIIKTLKQHNGEMELKNFLQEIQVPEKWFKDACEKSKIFNTFPLDKIEIFEIYTKKNHKKKCEWIKLDLSEKWSSHYKEALEKILKE